MNKYFLISLLIACGGNNANAKKTSEVEAEKIEVSKVDLSDKDAEYTIKDIDDIAKKIHEKDKNKSLEEIKNIINNSFGKYKISIEDNGIKLKMPGSVMFTEKITIKGICLTLNGDILELNGIPVNLYKEVKK